MSQDLGKLVLRVSLGVLILLHGIAKIKGGVGGIVGMVEAQGLPGQIGYLVYIGEVLAPVFLIIGLLTRPAALIVALNMLVAVALAHKDQIAMLNEKTGGWAIELQGMFLFAAIAIALIGAGKFSLGGAAGRYN